MIKATFYLPIAACVLSSLCILLVSGSWHSSAASLVAFTLGLATLGACVLTGHIPDVKRLGLSSSLSILFAALVIVSALVSDTFRHSVWGFSFDMTTAMFIVVLVALSLVVRTLPVRQRQLVLAAALIAGTVLWVVPYLRTAPEIRPGLSATFSIVGNVSAEGAGALILGKGPNTFSYLWQQHAPGGFLETPFWAERFPVGSGVLPTLLSEVGVITTLLLVLALLAQSVEQAQALYVRARQRSSWRTRALDAVSVMVPLVALVALVFAQPSAALFLCALVAAGASGMSTSSTVSSTRIPRMLRFIVVAFFVLLMVAAGYLAIAATFYFRASALYERGDLMLARAAAERSYTLTGEPQTARLLVSIARADAHALAQRGEVDKAAAAYGNARSYVLSATVREPSEANNWILVGIVSAEEYAATRDGALFEVAREALATARLRAPLDARIPYFQGQLYLLAGRKEEGVTFLRESLSMRADFTDAKTLLDSVLAEGGSAER